MYEREQKIEKKIVANKLLIFLILFSVSEIRSKGKNASNTYIVPDEHSFSEEIILEQLQIIDTLFPYTKVRSRDVVVADAAVAEKRNSSDDDESCSAAKRKKVETAVNGDSQASTIASTTSTSTSDKAEIVNQTTNQPLSRLELKESIKRAFEASKGKNSDLQSDGVAPISQPPTSSSSSKVTRDIHQYISVVNPKGQMQKKLDQAAPYNFFLTTITDSKPTYREPLSVTFQGEFLISSVPFSISRILNFLL